MTDAPFNLQAVEVTAPARLHFGLFTFGGTGRTYGGVGAAITEPAVRVRIEPGEELEVSGLHGVRVRPFVEAWQKFHRLDRAPCCRVTVLSAAPEHVGLGLGTQLGLATAAGLNAASGMPPHSPIELAVCSGRGERSSVGAYAFCLGGLVVEGGKQPAETLSPLECRMPIPDSWRFLLARPALAPGLSGAAEQQAFQQLPPVSESIRQTLIEEVSQQMLPALAAGDLNAFGASVTQFGRTAGLCYERQQGGPYNGPLLSRLVATLLRLGAAGVGQSSWGPTIFALTENQQKAEALAAETCEQFGQPLEMQITSANNQGAVVQRING